MNSPRFGRQNFEKILYDDERNDPRFGRQNLKKFWMTMNETAKIWQTKFEKILDDDERAKRSERNENCE